MLLMRSFFHFFTKRLRLSNPWRYKIPLLISFTYFLLLASLVDSRTAAVSFFAAIATTIGFMGFGYITNDLSDRKKDRIAGKPNSMANLSVGFIVALIIGFTLLAIIPWYYLPVDKISTLCILGELVLFILYAFPPFRLKERGVLGIITDALYAHALPAFLASYTFYLVGDRSYENFWFFSIALFVWQLVSGARNILSHQYKDFENDIASGTKTLATKYGAERINQWILKGLIPLEVTTFLVFVAFVQFEVQLLVLVLLVYFVYALQNYRSSKWTSSEPKSKQITNLLDAFYIKWFPAIVILMLVFGLQFFWWIAIFHVLFFYNWQERVKRKKSSESQEQNQEERLSKVVGVFSVNKDKYSETFIHSHIQNLSNVVVYSDGYFPKSVSIDRGKSWSNLEESEDREASLIKSLRENKVEVVLAEYGLAGVEVMHVCQKMNLPLVVHFHGFDAYRNDVLSNQGKLYPELFQIASSIVVVSIDMKEQLLRLGCSNEKLKLIPYGVDVELFYKATIKVDPISFLACGRFVPKKAPLNTIKAFKMVTEEIPEAKLTFIGEGELLDDAVRLSKELGIEEQIDFKGVLSPNDVASEMKKHAIFLQHSIKTEQNDSEGTPLSILEAAASEMGIVATKHGGIVDVLEDGKSGFLVDENDIQSMSQKMIELARDSQLRTQFGKSAREKVVHEYDKSTYLNKLSNCIENATPTYIRTKSAQKIHLWKMRTAVFLILFLLVELGLRIGGVNPGVIDEFYAHDRRIEYDSLMYGDEMGISHIVPGSQLIVNGIINNEGFFSEVEYDKKSIDSLRNLGKKIVMLVGDSYTQGCCADEYGESFASLINEPDYIEVLNFGIPGADPLQYKLIVEKYVPIIQPDLVLVVVYGGNDIMEYDRKPRPFIPLNYPIKNGPWLNSEGPIYLTEKGTYFKNFEEAKEHYFTYFSLWGSESNYFEKLIRPSILLSRPYLKLKTKWRFEEMKGQMPAELKEPPFSKVHLERLDEIAKNNGAETIFTLIPSPIDIANKENTEKKYSFVFGSLNWIKPPSLDLSDYDGITNGNHFNSTGHRKFAQFLSNEIGVVLRN